MSKKKESKNGVDESRDLTKIFPTSKIKSQLQKDERVGRLLNPGVEFVGACSALFVQQLVQDASGGSVQQGEITLEQIQQCVSNHKDKYDFLEDTVISIEEKKSASKYVDKKRKTVPTKNAKTDPPKNRSTAKKQKALEKSILEEGGIGGADATQASELKEVIRTAQIASAGRIEIVEDDDDYD
mmetsp:Transcript_3668/g.5288  ORF Transcript_3668/g.5288 Transcript_3668/m.5288 type:complete len:184 (+) Transcript_3668:147-698(+)